MTNVTQEQDFLLGRECALAASSIGSGLTLLRKYDFVRHAYGTQAFFMLSVGIERLLKIIVIYDYRRKNNNIFPSNGVLKKSGHNIKSLYKYSINVAEELNLLKLYETLKIDPIYDLIIDFLNDFANAARYYNLDSLTGQSNKSEEPLRNWNNSINSIIVKRHYKPNLKKESIINELSDIIGEHVLVSFDSEKGDKICNIKDFYLEGLTVDVKQKYSMFYVYSIVRFLSKLLWQLDQNYFPVFSEYFNDYMIFDDKYVRSKKVWNIYEK